MEAGTIIFLPTMDVLIALHWKWCGEIIYCVRSCGTEQEPVFYGNEDSLRKWVKSFGNYKMVPPSEWVKQLRGDMKMNHDMKGWK